MAEIARALVAILFAAALLACGFFSARWYDGTLMSKVDADLIAQARVDEAAVWAVQLSKANDAKTVALSRIQAPPRVVSLACPPGAGAVSDDALARLRDATMLDFK